MKKILILFLIICQGFILNAQSITGILVDQSGIPLSGLQLNLYINPNIYSATSGPDGSFTFNSVTKVKEEKLPTGYSVSENFPNPFNPKTRIFITLPNSGNVKVNIYNLLGQKVLSEINRYFNTGTSYLDLELKGLPNGIYLARISIDNKFTVVKKIMLLYGSQHLNTSVTEQNIGNYQPKSLLKKSSSVNIDSLVVTGRSIKKNIYTNFQSYAGASLNLDSLIVNTQLKGTPCIGVPAIKYAGQVYNTVKIGNQCWLKENLNVGTMIPGKQIQLNNRIIEKYCYNDSIIYCNKYGGLYQWSEAVQFQNGTSDTSMASPALTGNVQGICPTGWHIPSQTEFEKFDSTIANNSNSIKAVGQGSASYGGAGTDTTGFSALLSGIISDYGDSYSVGLSTFFWSYREDSPEEALYIYMLYNDSSIYFTNGLKIYGFSVRCIKD